MSKGFCPVCMKDTNIELDWKNLSRDDLRCNHCNTDLYIELEDSYDGVSMWLMKKEKI